MTQDKMAQTVTDEQISALAEGIKVLHREGYVRSAASLHTVRALLSAQPAAVTEERIETAAQVIYAQWASKPGYVAWVPGGNSEKQDDARKIARTLLSPAPADETDDQRHERLEREHFGDPDKQTGIYAAQPQEETTPYQFQHINTTSALNSPQLQEAKPVAGDDILRLADNYAHDMLRGYGDVARQTLADALQAKQFQSRVLPWMLKCFGETISNDLTERNHRFLEEALELVQSTGCTQSEAHQLVDYVYGRPVGERSQEVGGVMVTLAALCLAAKLNMHAAGETELERINEPETVLKIRAKQAAKPKHSPLPQVAAAPQEQAPLTETYIQTVPDKCDRIVWRNTYYQLPIKEQTAPADKDAIRNAALEEAAKLAALAIADGGHLADCIRALQSQPQQEKPKSATPEIHQYRWFGPEKDIETGWHDEGTGPAPSLKYYPESKATWRVKP